MRLSNKTTRQRLPQDQNENTAVVTSVVADAFS